MIPGRQTISEISAEFGISLRTLRFYEEKGLLLPERVGTSRYYTAKDRIRLQLILKGRKLGFSLFEIERLIKGTISGEDPELTSGLDVGTLETQLSLLLKKRAEVAMAMEELQIVLGRR